jgi:hypothetical protein
MVTDMRLLTCVSPRMRYQGTTLVEVLVAILHRAVEGPLLGVYPEVTGEI